MLTRTKNVVIAITLTVLFTILILTQNILQSTTFFKFPGLTDLVLSRSSRNDLIDLGGIVAGTRRIAADIAWIQLLQYYGTPEITEEHLKTCTKSTHDECGLEYGKGHYSDFLKLTLRIVRLDPTFYYTYLYSAGALAWNLERIDEALQVLKEGMKHNPKYWKFRLYLAGITYKQLNQYKEMVKMLEEAITYTDCPNMIKSILANIYELERRYYDALKLWINIYDSKDITYRLRSKEKIELLRKKVGL